jgi:hypothetical protein
VLSKIRMLGLLFLRSDADADSECICISKLSLVSCQSECTAAADTSVLGLMRSFSEILSTGVGALTGTLPI